MSNARPTTTGHVSACNSQADGLGPTRDAERDAPKSPAHDRQLNGRELGFWCSSGLLDCVLSRTLGCVSSQPHLSTDAATLLIWLIFVTITRYIRSHRCLPEPFDVKSNGQSSGLAPHPPPVRPCPANGGYGTRGAPADPAPLWPRCGRQSAPGLAHAAEVTVLIVVSPASYTARNILLLYTIIKRIMIRFNKC
eukprot:7319196-Pyramimonas_sp.AAC.1